MEALRNLIEKEKPAKIVTVGDQVSKDLHDHHLFPDFCVVDNRIMRRSIPPISLKADQTINVENPAGTITSEALVAVSKAAKTPQRTRIVVEGEEDLLTLAVISELPENSLVIYGQPGKGIVICRVTPELKQKNRKILNAMRRK